MYFRYTSSSSYKLPYVSEAGGTTSQINCIFALQKIFVYRHTFGSCRFTSADPGTQPVMINLPQTLEYRYILIPGLVSGGRFTSGAAAGYTVDQLKAMSYEDVRTLFNIPENGSREK